MLYVLCLLIEIIFCVLNYVGSVGTWHRFTLICMSFKVRSFFFFIFCRNKFMRYWNDLLCDNIIKWDLVVVSHRSFEQYRLLYIYISIECRFILTFLIVPLFINEYCGSFMTFVIMSHMNHARAKLIIWTMNIEHWAFSADIFHNVIKYKLCAPAAAYVISCYSHTGYEWHIYESEFERKHPLAF